MAKVKQMKPSKRQGINTKKHNQSILNWLRSPLKTGFEFDTFQDVGGTWIKANADTGMSYCVYHKNATEKMIIDKIREEKEESHDEE